MKIFLIIILLLICCTLQQVDQTDQTGSISNYTPGSLFDTTCTVANCDECSSIKMNDQNMCFKCKQGFYLELFKCSDCKNLLNCIDCRHGGCFSCEDNYQLLYGRCSSCSSSEKWNSFSKKCDTIYTPPTNPSKNKRAEVDVIGLIISGSVFGGICLIGTIATCFIISCIQRDHRERLKKNLMHHNFSPEPSVTNSNGEVNQGLPITLQVSQYPNNFSNRSDAQGMIDNSNNLKAPIYPDIHQL